MKKTIQALLALVIAFGASTARAASEPEVRIDLSKGWAIQSSADVTQKGDELSQAEFTPTNWYSTSIPSTVVATMVHNRVFADPGYGMNMRSYPGTTFPIGQNFSNLEMPPGSPFRKPWWYRTSFTLPKTAPGRHLWLHFDGINYRANVWLNGRQIANATEVVGMWRLFNFDVTGVAHPGEMNGLAVEVFPPQPDDLAITWVDWNPMPPDKDMGIWRNVYVTTSGPVKLSYPRASTHFDLPSLDTAHLSVVVEAENATDKAVNGTLSGQVGSIKFSQQVQLAPNESKTVVFSPDTFSQLNIAHPRVWWPAKLGEQPLNDLHFQFDVGGKTSDETSQKFGIREVTSELTDKGYRLFKINGKNILIRGGGWAPDMMLRPSPERDEAQLRYVLGMNLNAIRMEGKLESDDFLSLCDKYGILVMAGWCCCDHWERWKNWKKEDYTVAAESLRDQLRRLGAHACVFDWLYGSDNPPPPDVEQIYLKVIKSTFWPNPFQSSATAKPTTGNESSGVKMNGPYEYVSSNYWDEDTRNGGAFGLSTEISPGPAIPPVESLRMMLPPGHLWPIDQYWDYHTGGGEFSNVNVFTKALEARYGKADNVEDYAEKAQLMTYEGERAMFEGYGRNKYTSTGVIQWMLNNAWPSLIWHLFDYYLRPAGGYFGTQKACEPMHVQYSYGDHSVYVVNSYYRDFKNFTATAKVFNLDLTPRFSKEATLDIGPDSSNRVFEIPEIQGLSTTYFVQLRLDDHFGQQVSSNFYWLSTQPDVQEWDKTEWYMTPVKKYADYTSLKDLPKAEVKVSGSMEQKEGEQVAHVTVENPSSHLAFFVHMAITSKRHDEEVLPVLWQDNYFELMPGESRTITATYLRSNALRGGADVVADGWNITPTSASMSEH